MSDKFIREAEAAYACLVDDRKYDLRQLEAHLRFAYERGRDEQSSRIADLERQLAEARDRALEEAAVVSDDHTPSKHEGTLAAHVTGSRIAAAIRAMKQEDRT